MSGNSSSFVRPVISTLLVALTVLGLMNVYSDNANEVRMGSELACSSEACDTNLVQVQRSILSQSFTFQVMPRDHKGESKNVDVECARRFVFLGEYQCSVK